MVAHMTKYMHWFKTLINIVIKRLKSSVYYCTQISQIILFVSSTLQYKDIYFVNKQFLL